MNKIIFSTVLYTPAHYIDSNVLFQGISSITIFQISKSQSLLPYHELILFKDQLNDAARLSLQKWKTLLYFIALSV